MKRLAWILVAAAPCAWAGNNDFPTSARVEFVLACMRDQPAGPDVMYKCSCAIDAIAAKVSYDEWVHLATVANGITMAGERGGELRDLKDGRKIASTYREMQEAARKHCFLAR